MKMYRIKKEIGREIIIGKLDQEIRYVSNPWEYVAAFR